LDWKRKSVADTALGPDHLRRARIRLQFAPQPQDLHIDTAVENVPVYSGCLQELFAAEGALRRIEKGRQQRIFPLGQRDLGSGGVDKTAETPIELPATEVDRRRSGSRCGALRPASCRRRTARIRARSSRRTKGLVM
jgi:hypothetical protein